MKPGGINTAQIETQRVSATSITRTNEKKQGSETGAAKLSNNDRIKDRVALLVSGYLSGIQNKN